MIINTTSPGTPYKIGDVKLTTRTLDSHWQLCDGSLVTTPIDAQNILIENESFGYKQFTPSVGTYSDIRYAYIDSKYVLIVRKDNLDYNTTTGTRYIYIDIYENLGEGNLNFIKTETIYSGTTSRSSTILCQIIKTDLEYYWILYGTTTGNKSIVLSKTFYLACQSVDNISQTWTTGLQIASCTNTAVVDYFRPCAFYDDDEGNMTIDFSTSNANPGYFDCYQINDSGQVTQISTYSTSIYAPSSWGNEVSVFNNKEKETKYVPYYYLRINDGKAIYKSVSGGDWQNMPVSSNTTSVVNGYYDIWFFNGLYFAFMGTNSSYDRRIIASATLQGLWGDGSDWVVNQVLTRSTSTDFHAYQNYGDNKRTTEYSVLLGLAYNGTTVKYLIIDKQNNISIGNTNLTLGSSQSYYVPSSDGKWMFFIEDYNSSNTKWYFVSTASPRVNISGVSAYIKTN